MEGFHSLLTKHLTGVGFNLKISSWVGPIIYLVSQRQGRTQDLSSRQDSSPRGPWVEEKSQDSYICSECQEKGFFQPGASLSVPAWALSTRTPPTQPASIPTTGRVPESRPL